MTTDTDPAETNRLVSLVLIDSAIDGMKDRALISTAEVIDILLDLRGLASHE